jgi:hypothetical protein
VREIVAYWSALVPREEIATRVEVVHDGAAAPA